MHKKLIGIFLTVSSLYSFSASPSPKNNFDSYWYWQSSVSPRYGVPGDFLKNYYAAIPPEFDINDPDKITRKFNNWSDIDNNYFIPKLVQEISTQGRRADTSISKLGIERIVKAGHYLYTPALEVDDNYNLDYALKDLGEL